jgi:hypothetical protein
LRKGSLAVAMLLGLMGSQLVIAASAAQLVPASADLAVVSNAASMRHAKVGQLVTFTVVAANNGPDAVDVYVHPDLPYWDGSCCPDYSIVSETSLELYPPVAICGLGVSGDGAWCEYDVLEAGDTVTTSYFARVVATGRNHAIETACVSSGNLYVDPNPANDCATASVRIVGKRN